MKDEPGLSPEMRAIVREALALRGWPEAEIDELLASGVLDDPAMRATLENDLAESLRIATAQVMSEVEGWSDGGGI